MTRYLITYLDPRTDQAYHIDGTEEDVARFVLYGFRIISKHKILPPFSVPTP